MATGVLLVLIGQATRITEYLMDLPKTYRGTVRLGVETTTYDAEGEVIATSDVNVSEPQVREVLTGFVGDILQVPPAHSAVKVDGVRAYNRARRGEDVTLTARPARIDRLDMLRFEPPDVEIEVECGKGHLHSLDRTRSRGGTRLRRTPRITSAHTRWPFAVEACADVNELEAAFESGTWTELLEPVDCGLLELPAITLEIEDEKDMRHGQAADLGDEHRPPDATEARAYAEDGSLIGIIRYDTELASGVPQDLRAR